MRLVLVLPHRNQAELDDFLKELYDPQSASYRKFLTVEEFTARFGPTQEDYDSVIRFAEANGFTVVGTSRNRMNLDVTGSVANVEKALHLAMGVYQHPTENRTFFAPDREPALDLALQLWHISGLDNYSIPKPGLVRRDASVLTVNPNATTGSGPDASFLGSDMRAAYYGGTALTGSGQSIGLFEFLGTDLTDLATYYTNAGQTNHVPVTLKSVDTQSTSCAEPTCDDTEQTLDMTQALGMAPGMSSLVMYIGTGGLSGQTLDDAGIFNAMATASPLNHQLSCSWNWKPADSSTDNVYFEEFAAQGQNLFVDAGDDGNWSHAEFVWPADSVYVTSVGGTDLATTGAAGPWASETGWADSGGGISPDDFAIPSWQVTAAAGCGACSQTYRNGPDVSANADFSFYVCADQAACTANEYGGTSFATPMWAGYMALVNQQAVLNGKPPLGFINPALYTIGLGVDYGLDFHDITSGGNTLGTTTGYDLSTGWGSPKGSALIDALVGTPTPDFTISASPTTVSVAPGKSGVSTITTAIAGGFDAAIALSATGQPTGVTATFNPTSIAAPGSGNSTLTLAVASTTAIGMYTITVKGTGGGLTESTKVTLSVTGNVPATMTTPASGSTLGTSNVKFTWTAGTGVTQYQLWLGTSGPGSSGLYTSGWLTTTSTTVTSLPAKGATVYARLYSTIDGKNQYNDYTYTEAGAPATMSTPAQGSTLGTSNVKFTWTAGYGVTQYNLWLGLSGPGSSSLYTSGWLAAPTTSTTVTSLPGNGVTVYARLYSTIGGKNQYVDYTYTEAEAGVPATMTTPAESGTVLGTSEVPFAWTKGTAVTQYQLWLGTTGAGSSGLYTSGWLTTQSTTVPSLPAKGATVYARLYSTIGGKNQYNDYTYVEQ
jgi:kumamolisin